MNPSTLSTDVTHLILRELDWRDLLNLQKVSLWFRDSIRDNVTFKYQIELGASGHVDNQFIGPLSIAERLKLLRGREKAKQKLVWKTKSTVPKLWGLTELSGGVLAQSAYKYGDLDQGSIHFTRLPSYYKEQHSWSLPIKRHGHYRGYKMDPNQDLLVVISFGHPQNPGDKSTCVLLSICRLHTDTYEPHPEARLPILHNDDFIPEPIYPLANICGAFVGVLNRHQTSLNVWNWKTGETVLHLRSGVVSFTFLSERYLLLFKSITTRNGVCSFTVNDLESAQGDKEGSSEVEFMLPRLLDDITWMAVDIRCNPISSFNDRPFAASPHQCILAMILTVSSIGRTYTLMLVVPNHIFLKYLPVCSRTLQNRAGLSNDIPWDRWGVSGSRIIRFPIFPDRGWTFNVHGNRFVCSEGLGFRQNYSIYDFGSSSVRDAIEAERERILDENRPHGPPSQTATSEIFSQPTTLKVDGDSPFAEEVVTCLPYCKITSKQPLPNLGLMLTEDT